MAVTVINRPFELVPAYNDVEFYASSTQTARPNFVYYVKVTVDTGDVLNYRIPADPSGKCYVNLVGLVRKFVKNDYPFGIHDWTYLPNNTQGFTVNIGEEYGITPTIYPGSDYYFTAWNGSLTKKERSTYRFTDYAATSAGGFKWLNGFDNARIKAYQDLMIYFIQWDYAIDHVIINTYNSGGLENTVTIDSPLNALPAMVAFNVSPDSINALVAATPSRVSSATSLPVFLGDEIRYTVLFCDSTDSVVGGFNVDLYAACENMFTEHNLYYLNRFGAYDCQPMQGNHRENFNITKKYYQGLLNKFEASYEVVSGTVATDGPNPLSISTKALNISYEGSTTLLSQPLTQTALNAVRDMFASPNVFLNIAFADYVRYSQGDTTYQLKQELVEKLVTIEATLNAGVIERRQNE